MGRKHWGWWLFYGFGALVAFFMILPCLIVIPISSRVQAGIHFGGTSGFHLRTRGVSFGDKLVTVLFNGRVARFHRLA